MVMSFKLCLKAAELGHEQALTSLSMLIGFYGGPGIQDVLPRAKKVVLAEATPDNLHMLYVVGKSHWCTNKIHYLQQAADNGHPVAQAALAEYYFQTSGTYYVPDEDTPKLPDARKKELRQKAEHWREQAANNGYPNAVYRLASDYGNCGGGYPKDLVKAYAYTAAYAAILPVRPRGHMMFPKDVYENEMEGYKKKMDKADVKKAEKLAEELTQRVLAGLKANRTLIEKADNVF